nr:rhomboid family intramembrane serine protease [Haloferula luteola]
MPRLGGFALEVAPEHAEPIRHELGVYAGEREVPFVVEAGPPLSWGLALVWGLLLLGVQALHERDPELPGRWLNDARRVWEDGEWWRAFTALFLHADAGHLLGNLLIGGSFCVMVGTVFGAGRGWALILASGFLGNLATGWIHWHFDEPFRSLGASTATFGALGLIVGAGLVRSWRERRYGALKPLMVPLAAGGCLLSLYGAGGENTDVLGHLCGTGMGVVLGILMTLWLSRPKVDWQ